MSIFLKTGEEYANFRKPEDTKPFNVIDDSLKEWMDAVVGKQTPQEKQRYYDEGIRKNELEKIIEVLTMKHGGFADNFLMQGYNSPGSRYIINMLQVSVGFCDFLYSAIIDSVRVEITTPIVPASRLLSLRLDVARRYSEQDPFIAHVPRNENSTATDEADERHLISNGLTFFDEIESLGKNSALRIIFNEVISAAFAPPRYTMDDLMKSPYHDRVGDYIFSLENIILISIFHAPKPTFIELAGEAMDIGIPKEDLYFRQDNGVSWSYFLIKKQCGRRRVIFID